MCLQQSHNYKEATTQSQQTQPALANKRTPSISSQQAAATGQLVHSTQIICDFQ